MSRLNNEESFPEEGIHSELTEFSSGKLKKNSNVESNNFEVIESSKFLEEVELKGKDEESEVDRKTRKVNKGWQSYMGIVLTMCSGLMFAVTGLIAKYLKGYHAMNLGFFRFTGILLPAIPFLIYVMLVQKKPVFNTIWPVNQPTKLKTVSVLFGRAFVSCIAVNFHFYAIQYMSLADAMVIGSCSPVFVTFVAHTFLGEKCGFFPIITALLTIVGVSIIARPPMLTGEEEFDMDTLIGAGFALGRMMFTSFAIVFVRYLREVHVALVLFSVGLLQLVQNTSIALIMGVFSLPSDPYHLALACGLGLASFVGQMSYTMALKSEQAGPFAIVRTSDVIFAFILQFIFLGTAPDLFSVIGSIVVIVGVSLTVFRKWLGTLPEYHTARKTYWFILK